MPTKQWVIYDRKTKRFVYTTPKPPRNCVDKAFDKIFLEARSPGEPILSLSSLPDILLFIVSLAVLVAGLGIWFY